MKKEGQSKLVVIFSVEGLHNYLKRVSLAVHHQDLELEEALVIKRQALAADLVEIYKLKLLNLENSLDKVGEF